MEKRHFKLRCRKFLHTWNIVQLWVNRSGSNKRGSGVAAYVRDNIEIKLRDGLSTWNLMLKAYGLKLKGKNRNSAIHIGVFY